MDLSETFRVVYQINLRNSASRWLSLQEYITMHGPLNVKLGILLFFLTRFVAGRTLQQYELRHELDMAPDHSSVLIHIYTVEINVKSLPHKVRCCTKAKSH